MSHFISQNLLRFCFLFFAFLVIIGCEEQKIKPTIDSNLIRSEMPSQESWGATIIFSDSGKTRAIMKVGHLRMYLQAQETLLDSGIVIDFYDEQEVHSTTLTAKWGRVDDREKDLYAHDSVVAVTDDNIILRTEKLVYRNRDQKITTDQYVTITSPTERVAGYGFESDRSLKNYTIFRIAYTTRMDSL